MSNINIQGTGLFSSPERDFNVSAPISREDILSWRERNEEWIELERLGKTSISTSIELETDLLGEIEVPVEASLKKPEIVQDAPIHFGKVQIGDLVSKDVQIYNPTSEPLELQLFLGFSLDNDFFGKSDASDEIAWNERGAFNEKMLRQISIFMKGVSLDLVERVEYMFETFKQQNALNFEINYENI